MSRNQSINKIAPHINNALSSVQGVNESHVPPFSPYAAQAEEKESKQEKHNSTQDTNATDKTHPDNTKPEIFTLVANPDFSELFVIALGKGDSDLLFTIKEMRKKRGVTSLVPISDNYKTSPRFNEKYQNIEQRISSPKGEAFTGEM